VAQESSTVTQERDAAGAGLLGIYLNDHLATLTLAVELARRAANARRGKPSGDSLERVGAELDDDRSALLEIMRALDVPVRQYKVIAARAAELIGRLKPNGHLLSRSPLSDIVEVEGLRAAVQANVSCWGTLHQLAAREPRLDTDRLMELLGRAQRQSDALEECRRQAVTEAFLAAPVESNGHGGTRVQSAAVEPPAHDELPLPDYDHLPTGSLAARIKPLDAGGVDQLLAYERAHANRLPVVMVLEHRLTELAEGARPTSGDVTAPRPETPPAPAAGSTVSPTTSAPPTKPTPGEPPTQR
jgi:hypothetical protein